MSAASSRLDRWIFESHALRPESLGLYRIVYGLFLLTFAMPNVVWVASLPSGLFDPPPGPLGFFEDYPPAPFFYVLNLGLALAAVALTLGFRTRQSSILTGVLLVAVVGFEYCLGKIDHNRHLLMVIPLVLSGSGWGARYSLDGERGGPTRGWPVALLAFALALFFFASAVPKIVSGGWLDPTEQAVAFFVDMGWSPLYGLIEGTTKWAVWELVDQAAVWFEAGFVVAIFFGIRWTRILCAVAVLFHTANLLILGISFPEQLIVYGAFVEWAAIPGFQRLGPALDRLAGRLRSAPWLAVGVLGSCYFALHATTGVPLATARGYPFAGRLLYDAVPASAAMLFLGRQLRDAARDRRR